MEYKNNSFKHKEEQKRNIADEQRKAVEERRKRIQNSGKATVKKKNGFQKFVDEFINVDMPAIKDYVIKDVVIPMTKRAISDTVMNTINMLFYGEQGRNKVNSNSPVSKVSYRSFYDNPSSNSNLRSSVNTSTYAYDEITFDSRGYAELVLQQMDDIIATYNFVRVADFYELIGKTGSYTDNNYGWTNLRSAQVVQVRDGYKIKLPRALPLD